MRIFLLVLCILPIILFAQEPLIFEHDGIQREYYLHIPDEISENAPLVFVLHGYTSSASVIMGYSGMSEEADVQKFAVCYPQGTLDLAGTTHWNSNLNISQTDDIGFISELAAFLQKEHNLNPAHTFSCGMSNGGFMSYTLACEKPEVFKAIASVTGTMSGYDWNNCTSSEAVPIFQISGLADGTVPVDGSITTFGGWGGAPDYITVNNFWKDKNACTETETGIIEKTAYTYHTMGSNQNEVWLYAIDDMAHTWPGWWSEGETGIIAAKEIWKFFNKVVEKEITSSQNELNTKSKVLISPNPVRDLLQIENIANTGFDYVITSLTGTTIKSGESISNKTQLDLSQLAAGSYFIKIEGRIYKFLKVE